MDHVETIRAFNRFYAHQIGLLGPLGLEGLSYTEARVLFEIGSRQHPSARELVRALGLDEGYISRIIKALDARDLIDRAPAPHDARINVLRLTRTGETGYETIVDMARSAVGRMIADLPDASLDVLLTSLKTVQGVLATPDLPAPAIRGFGTGPNSAGDLGWVIQRHGALYAAHLGFDGQFEALVARILSDFAETTDPADQGWIAEADGLRLGSVFIVREGDATARLRLMLVEPFARGQGVGQSLVETAIDHARAQGFQRIVLWTQPRLEAACRLYARNGFELRATEEAEMFGCAVTNQTWECCL